MHILDSEIELDSINRPNLYNQCNQVNYVPKMLADQFHSSHFCSEHLNREQKNAPPASNSAPEIKVHLSMTSVVEYYQY